MLTSFAAAALSGCFSVKNTYSDESGESAQTEISSDGNSSSDGETSQTESSKDKSNKSYADLEPVSDYMFAMDTYMTVTVYAEEPDGVLEAAVAEIARLDSLLSTGDANSEVYGINQNGGGTLSSDTEYLLKRSIDLWNMTDGRFDIAIYPIMEAWGFTSGNFSVPDEGTLNNLLKLTDVDDIIYDSDNSSIQFKKEGMAIDFGGIAKGYTSSRIMEIFEEYGILGGLVNLGGNAQVYGDKPTSDTWKVAIYDPNTDDGYLCILEVDDEAVITSGGYERYFEEDGVTYHHIINPDTGYPANSGLTSVSIICADGTLADGLSTSLFIMGLEAAEQFWREHSNEFDVVLLDDEGRLYISEGLKDRCTCDYDVEVIYADS